MVDRQTRIHDLNTDDQSCPPTVVHLAPGCILVRMSYFVIQGGVNGAARGTAKAAAAA